MNNKSTKSWNCKDKNMFFANRKIIILLILGILWIYLYKQGKFSFVSFQTKAETQTSEAPVVDNIYGNKTVVYKENKLVIEETERFGILKFLYTNSIGKIIRLMLRPHIVSKIYSIYQDSFLSTWKINRFIRKNDINMNDFVVPEGGFRSFNDFFIRKLKSGIRTIDDDPSIFTAPADSRLLVVPELSADTRFFVKSKPFYLHVFLNDDSLAKEYEHGTLLLFRLAPIDYHRYHFPCDAIVSTPVLINGILESVNPLVYKSGLLPLQENERHRVSAQTKNFDKIVMVSVGAMFVGRITHLYETGREHEKGDEMGYFSFGGSSLVCLLKPGIIQVDDKFLAHSRESIETMVKMGERIGTVIAQEE